MVNALLIIHLSLAFCLLITFCLRIYKLFKKQNSLLLRKLFYLSSIFIVASGTLLSVVAKVPITAICLQSLGIVAAVSVVDFVITTANKKLESTDY